MKKFLIMSAMVGALALVSGTKATAQNNYVNFSISAADDTITGVDTANLYADFGPGLNYELTFVLKVKEAAAGTLAGAGVTLWGRNSTTDDWTPLTASNYYTAMQASDALIDGDKQFVYIAHNHNFRYYWGRVISSTGTAACTGKIWYGKTPTDN